MCPYNFLRAFRIALSTNRNYFTPARESRPTRQRSKTRTREAQVRECFIAPEKIDYFYLIGLSWIHRFQGRKPLIHRNVDLYDFKLFRQHAN